MDKLYPLGTIVSLKNGQRKLMIVSRVPLMNQNGTIGYFDYGGCLVPDGQSGNQLFFFNNALANKPIRMNGNCVNFIVRFT